MSNICIDMKFNNTVTSDKNRFYKPSMLLSLMKKYLIYFHEEFM